MSATVAGGPKSALPSTDRKPRRKRGLLANIVHHWADYAYIFPALAVMVLVIGYPIVYTILLAFQKTDRRTGANTWNAGANFGDILRDDRFWQTTQNTIIWTIGSTGGAFILGFGAALVLHKQFIGRGVVRATKR